MSLALTVAERASLVRQGLIIMPEPPAFFIRKKRIPTPPTDKLPAPTVRIAYVGTLPRCGKSACREPVGWSTLVGRYMKLCTRHAAMAARNTKACKARRRELDQLRQEARRK